LTIGEFFVKFLFLCFAAMLSTPALAGDLVLAGTYGNSTGCATANNISPVPPGRAEAVSAKTMWDGESICTVLDATKGASAADGAAWDVKVSCEAGDEVAVTGTVKLVEATDHSLLTATAPDKVGPKGRLKLCPAS
jgi:hypothetical protein